VPKSIENFLRGGTSSTSGVDGLASVTDAPSSGGAGVSIAALARHRVSKVSGSVGAHACEFGAHACESPRLAARLGAAAPFGRVVFGGSRNERLWNDRSWRKAAVRMQYSIA
jgi:hypothetical protein